MIKHAHPEHSVSKTITQRWSPYGFTARPVAPEDLRALFEAARWAPSSYNAQPWRYIVGIAGDAVHARVLACLVEANRAWAQYAPVLALGLIRHHFAHNDRPNAAAEHDLGLASAHLTFEATTRGIAVHQMIGILPEKARSEFAVPEEFRPLTALAIGYAGANDALPEALLARDATARERRPIAQFVHGGDWDTPAEFIA